MGFRRLSCYYWRLEHYTLKSPRMPFNLLRSRQKSLSLEIARHSNLYPKDDLLTDYRSFLKERDKLKYYQFNPIVFESLVNLTIELWNSKLRINRFELISAIKIYSSKLNDRNLLSAEAKSKLFHLFLEIVVFENIVNGKSRNELIQNKINSCLINVELPDEHLKILIDYSEKSNKVLNRLLRYPVRNLLISKWVSNNFESQIFATRRAEAIGWVLDIDSNFVISRETLINDFKVTNEIDKKIIGQYEIDAHATKVLNKEFKGIAEFNLDDDHLYRGFENVSLTRRFYGGYLERFISVSSCDFKSLEIEFMQKIDIIFNVSMIWGIFYSRLYFNEKESLLPKYFHDDAYQSYFNAVNKLKSLILLKGLEKKIAKLI